MPTRAPRRHPPRPRRRRRPRSRCPSRSGRGPSRAPIGSRPRQRSTTRRAPTSPRSRSGWVRHRSPRWSRRMSWWACPRRLRRRPTWRADRRPSEPRRPVQQPLGFAVADPRARNSGPVRARGRRDRPAAREPRPATPPALIEAMTCPLRFAHPGTSSASPQPVRGVGEDRAPTVAARAPGARPVLDITPCESDRLHPFRRWVRSRTFCRLHAVPAPGTSRDCTRLPESRRTANAQPSGGGPSGNIVRAIAELLQNRPGPLYSPRPFRSTSRSSRLLARLA